MKIIFLGTNGWYTSPMGNTACVLIDSRDHYVVFDAGNGIYKLDKYITQDKPVSLFISHFHLDHTSGLHTLGKFKFKKGLDIYFAEGRKKDFDTLVHIPYTIGITPAKENIHNLKMPVRTHELSLGKHDIGFPVEIQKLFHAYTGHGYSVTLEGKTVVYTGDTGVCQATKTLTKNADVLIHECSYFDPEANDKWGHVTPQEAATVAKEAGVKKLLLTHFDAMRYASLADREIAQKRARKIFTDTIAARDDMVVTV